MSFLLDNYFSLASAGSAKVAGTREWAPNNRYRRDKKYDGDVLPVEFEADAATVWARTVLARSGEELEAALMCARKQSHCAGRYLTSVRAGSATIRILVDVAIAEVSEREAANAARRKCEEARKKEPYFSGFREKR